MPIAALRPAPLQVGYLGFLGTSGGGFLDYLIADPVCVPPAERALTEQLVHLPECCLVFGEARARPGASAGSISACPRTASCSAR